MTDYRNKRMLQQAIVELIIGTSGIVVLLFTQNQWSYLSIILYGIISVFMVRRTDTAITDEEKQCIKKRNITSLITLPFFAVICYFSANETMKGNWLWTLLAVYLFIVAHGLMFIAPMKIVRPNKR